MEGEEKKRLFGKLCYVHRQMTRENHKIFSECNISPVQMHALVFIGNSERKGVCVKQKDIETQVNLRPSSLSTLLKNLEKGGYITRTVSEGDAREKNLALTEKGRQICLKDRLLMDKCDDIINNALTPGEQQLFDELLTKILSSINEKQNDSAN